MKKVLIVTVLSMLIFTLSPAYGFQPTAIDPRVEVLTPGVTRDFTITQYNNFPQDFSFFLVFLIGYGPVQISMSSSEDETSEGDLLVLSGWALSSAGIAPIIKFGRSRVTLVAGAEIGSERYPTGIKWFSSWIASPIEEEVKYYIEITF